MTIINALKTERTIVLGLCEGRYEIPGVDKYIFGNEIVDVTNTSALVEQANTALFVACNKAGILSHVHTEDEEGNDADAFQIAEGTQLVLYVTGLTVALGAVINAALSNKMHITLMHFNRDSGSYYPQTIAPFGEPTLWTV